MTDLFVTDEIRNESQYEHIFQISVQCKKISRQKYREILNELYNMDVGSDYMIPLYSIISPNIIIDHPKSGSLIRLSLVAERFKQYVDSVDPDVLICAGDISEEYYPVLIDIADSNNIDIVFRSKSPQESVGGIIQNVVSLIYGPILFFIDQIYTSIINNYEDLSNLIFMPTISREESIKPVVQEIESDFDIIKHNLEFTDLFTDSDETKPEKRAISSIFDMSYLISEIRLMFQVLSEVLYRRNIETHLITFIQNTTGCELPRTVHTSVLKPFYKRNELRSLIIGAGFQQLLDDERISSVVVGGMSARSRAVTFAAHQKNIQSYYIPHSIETFPDKLPPSSTIHFIPGQLAESHYRETYSAISLPIFKTYGRPYLENIYTPDIQPNFDSIETIVIATQPHADDVRNEFINECLDAVSHAFSNPDVIIKTHPSESTSFYRDPDVPDWIEVADDNLYEHLLEADVTITPVSNVGIEAVLCGSICINYNRWSPIILDQPYMTRGVTNVADSLRALKTELVSMKSGRLKKVWLQQFYYTLESYTFENSASRIADMIQQYNE